jgi:hypothetical protein
MAEEYYKRKTEITETCKCLDKNFCGICFWKGITIPPEIGKDIKCRKCQDDTTILKEKIKYSTGGKIEFQHSCCSSCLWWDWFDNIRKQIASKNNIILIYNRRKE